MAGREHGTLLRAKKGPDENGNPGRGCRCTACREKASTHKNTRARMLAYGRWQPFVDAGPAREHVRSLTAAGIGAAQVARLAGVSETAVAALLYPREGRPPSRRIRPETEAAILAVRPDRARLSDGTKIDAAGSRRRVQALARQGWTIARQGEIAGFPALDRIIRQPCVTVATERRIRALYDGLWDQVPPEETLSDRVRAGQARSLARRNGWVPPLGWDEEAGSPHCIDNPDAVPVPGCVRGDGREHGALTEEAVELARQDEHPAMIARRLGASQKTVERTLVRAGIPVWRAERAA